jgi:hypothetical protein
MAFCVYRFLNFDADSDSVAPYSPSISVAPTHRRSVIHDLKKNYTPEAFASVLTGLARRKTRESVQIRFADSAEAVRFRPASGVAARLSRIRFSSRERRRAVARRTRGVELRCRFSSSEDR